MEFNGLPLHPLVVHAAVVFAPLAAVTGLAYAARPGWRWWLRWPLVVLAVLAAASVGAAFVTGLSFNHQRFASATGPLRDAIDRHRHRALWLLVSAVLYAGSAVLAAWSLGGPSAMASHWGERESRAPWSSVALVLVVAGALAVLVTAFLTGDAGARAVWNP